MSPAHKYAPKIKYTRLTLFLAVVAILVGALVRAGIVSAQGGSPGTLSFSAAEYDVGEGVGNANITLTRTGGTSGAVTAKVSLTDVTTSPADYRISPGSVDPSFAPSSQNALFEEGQQIALQPDGKVLLAAFGLPLTRVNPDGTPDKSFTPPAFNAPVAAIALQPDGKIVVAGSFTGIPGMIRVARLNPDGSLDSSFNVGAGPNEDPIAIAIQPDGKIVIGGYFTSVNQTVHQHIARLNADGSVDNTFNPTASDCYALAIQSDGKILAGTPYLLRFNPDGTQDNSFPGTYWAFAIAPQPDGTIIIGGMLRDAHTGVALSDGVYRLLPDGSLDASFTTGTGSDGGIEALVVQPDGKIIAGGFMSSYNGTAVGCLIRLNTDGTLDPSFKVSQFTGVSSPRIAAMVIQPDGKVIAGGDFTATTANGARTSIARFNGDLFVNWKDGDAADKSLSIPVVDDLLDEPDETATLSITPLGGAAAGAIPTATLKIIDNDVPPSFTSSAPPQAITRVLYTHTFTANGTPAPTFSVTSGNLPPGLFLQSNGVLSGTPTTAGTYSNITVTASNGVAPAATQTFDITVASGGTLQFSSSAYSVGEGDGTVTITVNRVGGSAGSASVNYSAFGVTATSGSDYTLTPGTLNFADGETSKTFNVTIINDDVNERDETLNLFLSTAGGSATLGNPTTAVLTIVDDDPVPTISVDDVTVTEGDTGISQAVFTVTRTGQIDRAVTFRASTSDGTALAQEDYVPLPVGNLFQISPGTTSTTVSVSILGDTIIEPDKSFTLTLSSPTNATITRAQATCTIKDNDSSTGPPTIQFARRNFSASESDGTATVTVTRSGDTSAPASVSYATTTTVGLGSASDRSDYTTAFGTLHFAAGESSKTFAVYITDDALVEGDEVFGVNLFAPTGGATLGVPSTSLVKIVDNDTAPSSANPTDDTSFYVRQHYRDFLGRDPDASGLLFWTNEIESCGTDQQCRAVKRVNVSAAFFLSIEFQNTGYLVYRLYKASYNTGERLPFRTFLSDAQEIGQGVVVGSDGWEQKLEANKAAFLDEFVARQSFTTQYPQSMTPADFVDALNAFTGDPLNPTVGGSLTQAERDQLVADLTSGAKTRAQVLRAVAENQEFQRRQTNKAFVYMQYVGYLRRGPSDPPDKNFDGYNFWLGKLNQFNGNFVQAEMVKAFITSTEYRQRFGQP